MEQNDVPYDVALDELDALGVKLGELKATKDFTQGLPGLQQQLMMLLELEVEN